MTAAQFFPQFVLYLGVGQARSSLACDQVLPTGVRPIFQIVIERYPLLGAHTVVGRDPAADVILDDPGISRRHTEIRVTHDGPHLVSSVRDLASTNGTFVNGERITSTRLQDGDSITIGRTSMTFRAGKR